MRIPLQAGAAVVLAFVVAAAAERPPGTPTSREALAACRRARESPEAEQARGFEASLALAERAVAEDDRDALAHFAVFCSLGGQMRHAGIGLSALASLRRLRRE